MKDVSRKIAIAFVILPVFLSTLFCCCLSMIMKANVLSFPCHQEQANHVDQFPCHKDNSSGNKSCSCEHAAAITKHQIAEAANIINATSHESTVSLLAIHAAQGLFSTSQHFLAYVSPAKIIGNSVPLYLLDRVLRL